LSQDPEETDIEMGSASASAKLGYEWPGVPFCLKKTLRPQTELWRLRRQYPSQVSPCAPAG